MTATVWCECVVCEWFGQAPRGETLCLDCGNHLTSRCYVGRCKGRATMYLSDHWTCVEHLPVFGDDDETEHWTVAQLGDHEVVSADAYTVRGVGSLRMAVLTLSNGVMVSVPQDAVFIASERRQRLPAGSYGHTLWFKNLPLDRKHAFRNWDKETQAPVKEQLPPINSARWDCPYPVPGIQPIPLFRELDTPEESYRWVIRYTGEEGSRVMWGL